MHLFGALEARVPKTKNNQQAGFVPGKKTSGWLTSEMRCRLATTFSNTFNPERADRKFQVG